MRAFLLIVVVIGIGCGGSPVITDTTPLSASDLSPADIAAIRATSDRWMAAVREKRWEDAAATFTEDAILWFAGTPFQGRAAILEFHQSMPPLDPTRTLHIDEIRGRGDMAFVSGHSTITPAGVDSPIVAARYLDVRVRQADGRWLFLRDMVIPMAPQAAAQR